MSNTQVSFGNFPPNVRAKELADFLEEKVGLVLRCKVKKVSCNIPPHAFVHFISPMVAKEAIRIAEKGRLIFRDQRLKARIDDRLWTKGRRGLNSKVHSYIELVDVRVELGSITGPNSMLVSWRGPDKWPVFLIEPAGKRLRFFFNQYLQVNGKREKTRCDVMMEIRLDEVKLVQEVQRDIDPVLLLQLFSPPWIFYRTAEDDIHAPDLSQLADDEDPWIRCLDIITPNKSIGRCLDYMLTVSPRQRTAFNKAMKFFKTHRLLEGSIQRAYTVSVEANVIRSGCSHFFTLPDNKTVPFDLMFLVNALVQHGVVHTNSLSPSFYDLLDPKRNSVELSSLALKCLLGNKKPVFDAASKLQSVIQWATSLDKLAKEQKLVDGTIFIRRLAITPTRALCLPPEMELSNRVIRHYSGLSDRFLRVSFIDENTQSISSAALTVQVAPIVRDIASITYARTAVYNRIVSIMMDGFSLCGRNYYFLAFSAGQLRDASAWFFAGDGTVGVKEIRQWMGTFPGGNVAKHAARMGQCFSATFSTMQVSKPEVYDLEDIKRNNYDFSDGCGKISPMFAKLVAQKLKLDSNPPSVYQIRYAGYKGVVAVWPIEASQGQEFKLALRSSMKKFTSSHRQLEIVGWSRFFPAFLNRQIITLLSTLHVEDRVFMDLQKIMVDKLNCMVEDQRLAHSVLMTSCSGELYRTAQQMLCAGFDPRTEAYLKSMLVAIRVGHLDDLVQKTRIFVPKGRWLMGCLDETASLAYGQCFLRVSSPPKSVSSEEKRTSEVITGTVIMTKNPCMHPGDIRVLQAVNIPALHHLVDCLVVPQNGPRPHPNEASGSDLDGDVYFVCWDEKLLPPSRKSWDPMDYEAVVAKSFKFDVKIQDVVEFFAKHMVNDSLGKICNAHVVHADRSPIGALDKACLELAELAARAVDYPKTGKPAVMPFDLKPTNYPDFMEKEDRKLYVSEKIIGKLYRGVRGILPKEIEAFELEGSGSVCKVPEPVYDSDLEVNGFDAYLEEAWLTRQAYDQQLRTIMNQFDIQTEGEVVTGHVVCRKTTSRKQADMKERVKCTYLELHRKLTVLLLSGLETGQEASGESVATVSKEIQEAKASAWYHVTYHRDWYHKPREGLKADASQRPFLSFPWVAVEQLIAIKCRKVKLKR